MRRLTIRAGGCALLMAALAMTTGCDDGGGTGSADAATDATGFGGNRDGGMGGVGGEGGVGGDGEGGVGGDGEGGMGGVGGQGGEGEGGMGGVGGDGEGGMGGVGGDGEGGMGGAGGDGPCGEVGETRPCGDCPGSTQTCDGDIWGPCVLPDEICDGVDNNCNGSTDEGYAGLGEPCQGGEGACIADGFVVCNETNDGTTCDAPVGEPGVETCDGIDNDCDGEIDNGFADLGAACTAGEGACAAEGVYVCNADGDAVTCEAEVGAPAPEACNGIDDDCNGVVDDLPPTPCYDGPEGTAGVGVCAGGQRTCEDGAFGACVGQVLPGAEACNGIDNDCNGVIDDAPGTGAPCTAGQGVCAAQGQTVCSPEGVVCDAQPGEGGPEECDGLDNDCDGNSDEAIPAEPCYDGPDGTLGVGACRGGTRSCEGGAFGACAGQVLPGNELCDDEIDNDCDGTVNEAEVCEEPPECGDGVVNQVGEACDDGNNEDGDGCDANCQIEPFCGDGAVNRKEEQCDDGNNVDGDGCDADCRFEIVEPVCGNGEVEGGEQCDDGNVEPGDGCDARCQRELVVGRPNVLICGNPQRDISGIFQPADGVVVQAGCAPDAQTQALIVSRGGAGNANAAWADYVLNGGRIITEFSAADDVYSVVFEANVAEGAFTGSCRDNVNPVVRFNEDDPFWIDNAALPLQANNESGCGRDMSAWPEEIVPLGGWSPETVSLAYRDLGGGRVYLVEGDWQDDEQGADTFNAATQQLMRYMAIGPIPGNVPAGIQQDVPEADILAAGWQRCYQDTYDIGGVSLDEIFAGCPGSQMMIACRPVGSPTFTLAAAGLTEEVTRDVGDGGNAVNNHNGVDFYFSPGRSWGFAPEGVGVNRNSCDVHNEQPELRMCWHAAGGTLNTGYRCGNQFLNGDDGWERHVFVRNGGANIPVCGDGVVNGDEACDDGNRDAGDGCSAECLTEACGNNRVDAGEQCDDGNVDDGDGCDGECQFEIPDGAFASCRAAQAAGNDVSGPYNIVDTVNGGAPAVYCDMETDGGGWTLVGSTLNEPMRDEAAGYFADLTTLAPGAANLGVWNGLRGLQGDGNNWDIRFACRADPGVADAAMTVDLSFYETPWYREITTGTDEQSCFNEGGVAANMEVIPARRNNVSGDVLPEGDQWNAGALEGEDSCDSPNDFTVDFDDRGMDSDQGDGTDWGEDDVQHKCGQDNVGDGQWFIFVRESQPDEGELRLVQEGEDPGFGRLEIFFQGQWGTICDDFWSGAPIGSAQGLTNAEVACRQLGLRGALAADNPNPAPGVDPIWLDNVQCVGDEARLADCPANPIGNHNCGHGEDVSVRCITEPGVQCRIDAHCDDGDACVDGVCGAAAAVCGNGEVEAGEQCDDGNVDPGDGCDANCQSEIVGERINLMHCGNAARDLASFINPDDPQLAIVAGCDPDGDDQALLVPRSGRNDAAANGAAWRAYLEAGGIIITEYNGSDEVYNGIFGAQVAQGANQGDCSDDINPPVRFNLDDPFWVDNAEIPLHEGRTGCGFDLSAFPNIVPLGGWDADTVSLAYIDVGAGRLYLVEADWQDLDVSFTEESRLLMNYMIFNGPAAPFGFAGQFAVNDGPNWNDPGTVAISCVAACAQLFGGAAADYACSTVEGEINNRAFVDGWGDSQFCEGEGVAEDFVQPGEGEPYDCGQNACSYSAYVSDHGCDSVNYCWRLGGAPVLD